MFSLAAVMLSVTAIAIYLKWARYGGKAASFLVGLLVFGAVLSVIYASPYMQEHLNRRRWRTIQKEQYSAVLQRLGFLAGKEIGPHITSGQNILILGGPRGFLDYYELEHVKKGLERALGFHIKLLGDRTPECKSAEEFNRIIKDYRTSEIAAVISPLPISNRQDLVYDLESLFCYDWEKTPAFVAVEHCSYNPVMLKRYIEDGFLTAALISHSINGRLFGVSDHNLNELPRFSPQESRRYTYIEAVGKKIASNVPVRLLDEMQILIIGGPRGYMDERELKALGSAIEKASDGIISSLAKASADGHSSCAYNTALKKYKNKPVDLIIFFNLPYTEPREMVYNLEDLSCFTWDEVPLVFAVLNYHYNPDMLRSYIYEGLLGGVFVYTESTKEMVFIDECNLSRLPQFSPWERPLYDEIFDTGAQLGYFLDSRSENIKKIFIIGGPRGYLDYRGKKAMQAALEFGAGTDFELFIKEAPETFDLESVNEILNEYRGKDFDLILSFGLPVKESSRIVSEYELEKLELFNCCSHPHFVVSVNNISYNPQMLRNYLLSGFLTAALIRSGPHREKTLIGVENIEEMPSKPPLESLRQ